MLLKKKICADSIFGGIWTGRGSSFRQITVKAAEMLH
jgi:hypothetical protein